MTLTLSHGPWSVTIARPTDSRANFQAHYTLNERAEVDTTYSWDWKGQTLAGISNCTFSFSSQVIPLATGAQSIPARHAPQDAYGEHYGSLKLPGSITWSTSTAQATWYNATTAGSDELHAQSLTSWDYAQSDSADDERYVQIELNALFYWESDLLAGLEARNWHAGA
ncbi:hypothetical protein [Pseudomonas sp. UM16]|uniref:hypothetical protein n=1 Tax=Pseudomonas sp. UM16 TaxID=3158962 RepID=UPI00398FC229